MKDHEVTAFIIASAAVGGLSIARLVWMESLEALTAIVVAWFEFRRSMKEKKAEFEKENKA